MACTSADPLALAAQYSDDHKRYLANQKQQLENDRAHLNHYAPKFKTGIFTAHELAIEHHEKAIEAFGNAREHYQSENQDLGETEFEQGEFHRDLAQRFADAIRRFHKDQGKSARTAKPPP
jgi:hypothetical protein